MRVRRSSRRPRHDERDGARGKRIGGGGRGGEYSGSGGEQRTRWGAPTAKELGYDVVSYSPYGIVGPRGMDPKVVKILHDAFKKAIDDPENAKTLQQLDQVYWYKSSEDYARWAAETLAAERATIERMGLLAK